MGYVPAMEQAARDNGAKFVYEARGEQLIVTDGKVTGIFACRADGSVLQVNADAVILVTGGLGDDTELYKEAGWNVGHALYTGTSGHAGDIDWTSPTGAIGALDTNRTVRDDYQSSDSTYAGSTQPPSATT